jgi:hypothetical protein
MSATPDNDDPHSETGKKEGTDATGGFLLLLGCFIVLVAVDLAATTVQGGRASGTFISVGTNPAPTVVSTSGGDLLTWSVIILIGLGGLALAAWGERIRSRNRNRK